MQLLDSLLQKLKIENKILNFQIKKKIMILLSQQPLQYINTFLLKIYTLNYARLHIMISRYPRNTRIIVYIIVNRRHGKNNRPDEPIAH